MNAEQQILVDRLKEAGLHTRRFLKVDDEKRAFEKEWQKNPYEPSELEAEGCQRWGIIGRTGLVPIDTDNEEMSETIRKILPPTFEVLSPRRKLPHFYFAVESGEVDNKTLHLKGSENGAGEIRAQNQYLVAPGTITAYGKYEISYDRPIAKVKFGDFNAAVAPYLGKDATQRITRKQIAEGVPKGTRHAQGIKFANLLIGAFKLDNPTALQAMREWNKKLEVPMGDYDLERMVKNASEHVATRPRPEREVEGDPKKYFTFKDNGKVDTFKAKVLADDLINNGHFKTHMKSGEIFDYDDGYYKNDGKAIINKESERLLGGLCCLHYVNEVVGHVERSTLTPIEEFNPPLNLLCVNNGVYDLNTKEMVEHTPNLIFLSKIPIKYDLGAKCPQFLKFLGEILPKDYAPLIQEMFGYCLIRKYPFARAFMLLGEGENGKSTLINALTALIGKENVATPSLQDIVYNRFAQATLYGKLVNAHADIPSSKIGHTGRFKMLTGQDEVYAEQKHKDAFKFLNYAKLIYSANELPQTTDMSEAFWRRWILIKFSNVFPEGGPKTNPNILAGITTPEELSGLFNWALEGLERLLKNKKFSKSTSSEGIKKEWITRTDSLRAFVFESIEHAAGFCIAKDDFFNALGKFCAEMDITPIEKQIVGRQLPLLMPKVKSERPNIGGKQTRAWVGVRFKTHIHDVVTYYWCSGKRWLLWRGKQSGNCLDGCLFASNCKFKDKPMQPVIEEVEKTSAQYLKSRLFEKYGVNPFKMTQVYEDFKGAEVERLEPIMLEMEKNGELVKLPMESGESAWRIVRK